MKGEFTIITRHKYCGLVLRIIDEYGDKGLFKPFVATEVNYSYTRIWFSCSGKKAIRCHRMLQELEKVDIIRIEREEL